MTFPLRLLFPHNYHRFHVQEQCLHHMLQTVQKPTKSWEGSRLSNKASDQIRWLPITSIDAPQISARIHPLSHNLPRDAPHRSTHQTLIPLSPISLSSRTRRWMLWLMHRASAKAWKRWQAERQSDDSWMTRGKTANPKLQVCQQTACTLTLKETPHVSCIRSPPGLEVIITNFGSTQIQPCDCLVLAKGISQGLKKNGVSIAFPDPFSWTQWRACGNPVFAYN